MRSLFKTILITGTMLAGTAGLSHATDVEVLHWWTSGGEAAALNVLKEDLNAKGIGWVDMPVAGGGGEAAMTALRARVTAGDSPTAVQMLGFDILDWAEQGALGNLDEVAAAEGWDKVVPEALWELGADVISIGVEPDGFNINKECGSTAPEALSRKVREMRADIGIALDGDADRLIIVDERGHVVDGDQLLAVIAQSWKEDGRLAKPGIVSTVMSNLGLERFLKAQGIDLIRTAVGDRYVLEAMRARDFNVGGEQSGHIILSDFTTTGDGLVAALQLLAVVKESGRRVSEICKRFEKVPQKLTSVRFKQGKPLDHKLVVQVIAESRDRLGSDGRLVIRESGTEPVIRVMAESDDAGLVEATDRKHSAPTAKVVGALAWVYVPIHTQLGRRGVVVAKSRICDMRILLSVLLVALMALTGAQVRAADLPYDPSIEVPPVDYGLQGSFYLRGSGALNMLWAQEHVGTCACEEPVTGAGYGYSLGAGFGYETGTGLRVDGTVDYLSNDGMTEGTNYLHLRSAVGLVNAYYDI
eukprot:gene33680-45104_t